MNIFNKSENQRGVQAGMIATRKDRGHRGVPIRANKQRVERNITRQNL